MLYHDTINGFKSSYASNPQSERKMENADNEEDL
jgi:hypothetical protein